MSTQSIVAIHQDEALNQAAAGRIVYWELSGPVTREALVVALTEHGSKAAPPEEPSAYVALTRAVDAVAKQRKGEAHLVKRGEWRVVAKAHEERSEDGQAVLAYPIKATARVVDAETGTIEVNGEGAEEIRAAYEVERAMLSHADIGGWLCDKVSGLGGVALRKMGGMYFIPRDRVASWDRLSAAVKAASKHRLFGIPAMKSEDAVDAILHAIVIDTQEAVDKISNEINAGGLGSRALATRERETGALLERVGRYESILGQKLDALRDAIAKTQAGVAAAMLALGQSESDA